MKEIRCHQCATIQSSARDICIECGTFMKRSAEFMVGAPQAIVAVPNPASEKNTKINPSINPIPTDNPSGLPPETPMICCHKCYRVQLATEFVCIACGEMMERSPAFLFPASKMARPYVGPPPQSALHSATLNSAVLNTNMNTGMNPTDATAKAPVTAKDIAAILKDSATIDKNQIERLLAMKAAADLANINPSTAPSVAVFATSPKPIAPQAPESMEGPSIAPPPKVSALKICCHNCYAVHEATQTICNKCNKIMKRDSAYIFDPNQQKR